MRETLDPSMEKQFEPPRLAHRPELEPLAREAQREPERRPAGDSLEHVEGFLRVYRAYRGRLLALV